MATLEASGSRFCLRRCAFDLQQGPSRQYQVT
jgi:hypothetical protein